MKATPSDRERNGAAPTVVGPSQFNLLRRVESQSRKDVAGPSGPKLIRDDAAKAAILQKSPRNHSVAIGLIEEVATILPTLVRENEILRARIGSVEEKALVDLENATLVACEWRRSAETAKLRADNLEALNAELHRKLEAAEAALLARKEEALTSGQKAAEAECLSSLFEEKILESFGVGSALQVAMANFRSSP